MNRSTIIERNTNETRIKVELNIDGSGKSNIFTDIGFFDHMLTQFSKHGKINLFINVEGDNDVDCHHTVEDLGLVLGAAISETLTDKEGINRYGHAIIPMEEALVLFVVDICGRPMLNFDAEFTTDRIGSMSTEMFEEFFRAVCNKSGITMHIKLLAGKNNHHIAEAMFKAFGRAFREAVTIDPRESGIPSTKGVL